MSNRSKTLTLKIVIHFVSFYLLIEVFYSAINDTLGADPVEALLHFTGIGALNLLLLGLMVSPSAKYFKAGWLMQCRRLIGLYAFFYAVCHIASFWAFEIQFNLSLFISEIFDRPYITVGMLAFMILLSLAITSITVIKKRMGLGWQKLHNCVYVAVILVAVHFYWSVKSDVIEPSVYWFLIAVLLYLRQKKLTG